MQKLTEDLHQLGNNIKKDVMRMMKVEALKHYKRSFDNEGFTDKKLSKWQARKDKRNNKKILTDTRQLADTLTAHIEGAKVVFKSPTIYAKIHNEGGTAGRRGSAKIPKRQFLGESEVLNKKIGKRIDLLIKKRLK